MHLRNRLEIALQDIISPLTSHSHYDATSVLSHSAMIGRYYSDLFSIGVYPTKLTDSLVATLDSLDKFSVISDKCGCHYCLRSGDHQKRVLKVSREARVLVPGLCLDCIQDVGGLVGKCRVRHA